MGSPINNRGLRPNAQHIDVAQASRIQRRLGHPQHQLKVATRLAPNRSVGLPLGSGETLATARVQHDHSDHAECSGTARLRLRRVGEARLGFALARRFSARLGREWAEPQARLDHHNHAVTTEGGGGAQEAPGFADGHRRAVLPARAKAVDLVDRFRQRAVDDKLRNRNINVYDYCRDKYSSPSTAYHHYI